MPTVSVSAQIEILAAPSVVRSKFLEFEQSKQWQKSWTIELTEPGKQPTDLVAGDVVKVNMQGMTFRPIIAVRLTISSSFTSLHRLLNFIQSNTPESFVWEGRVPFLFSGKHYFDFAPSKQNPGGTTFVQREDFTGPLVTLALPWKNKGPSENWKAFNAALKKEVERSLQI